MTTAIDGTKKGNMTWYILYTLVVSALFVACFYTTLNWMVARFIAPDSYYTHGFIIPFISGFLIWTKRKQLSNAKIDTNWNGLIIVLLALLVHILGTILYIFSVSGFAIFLFLIGFSLFIFGREIFRIMLFPLLFLIFMFPLPEAFISTLSFPMKMVVAKAGVQIVSFIGIPIFREGFNITIPAGSLLVGNPCSGLRSLLAFMALGSVFAFIVPMTTAKRIVLFFSTIPIALVSNLIRVPMLILISHYWGLEAAAVDSFWHTASGMLVFVIGLVAFFILSKKLENGIHP